MKKPRRRRPAVRIVARNGLTLTPKGWLALPPKVRSELLRDRPAADFDPQTTDA